MKMKKIAEDHYVVVDDSDIKGGHYFLMHGYLIRQCDYVDGYMIIDTKKGKHHVSVCKKMTHSTQPLEWFGGEIIFLSEVKELLGVMDVEKKAQIEWGNVHRTGVLGYIDGYNQALEDNKEKKYTEEDLRKAISETRRGMLFLDKYVNEFIQSLQPKTEWEVEILDGKLRLKE